MHTCRNRRLDRKRIPCRAARLRRSAHCGKIIALFSDPFGKSWFFPEVIMRTLRPVFVVALLFLLAVPAVAQVPRSVFVELNSATW